MADSGVGDNIVPSVTIDEDLKETLEELFQFEEAAQRAFTRVEELELATKYYEEDIKVLREKVASQTERLQQTQDLVLKQQEAMNKLLSAAEENHELKKQLELSRLMQKAEKEKWEAEKTSQIQALCDEKKNIVDNYDQETAVLSAKLASQEQDYEVQIAKMEEEHRLRIEEYSEKLCKKENENNEVAAQHAAEKKELLQTIENHKTECLHLRGRLSDTINSNQKLIHQTDWNARAEIEGHKRRINELIQERNIEMKRNEELKNELQRVNKFREELSARYRSMQNSLIRADGTASFDRNQRRLFQQNPPPRPEPSARVRCPTSVGTPKTNSDRNVDEVSAALASHSLSATAPRRHRLFTERREPPAPHQPEEVEENQTYVPVIKRKKLFSENQSEPL